MISEGTRTWKGFRPGRFSEEVDQEEVAIVRGSNVLIYAVRAAAGLPIFSEETANKGGE
ncbi:hypothetical protein KKE19_01865 [Patescibacteria group bacterium]|nr:hypothetical protein [Patescibacteria group bacterium]MBU4274539.1 hypothetical protein [Patescibacteria group bacterium]MBU4367444.1 hypothetical protein [Patescibacteria group bacterium]MBU4461764.1 hypothetical protein [Patescibacteria group bacterium]MCG2700148.1 hypothetical protein [Candidatus Parcubacteria bacterium]